MKRFFYIFLTIAGFLYAGTTQAQFFTLNVNGTVINANGTNIPITISIDSNTTSTTVYSDSSGYFSTSFSTFNGQGDIFLTYVDCNGNTQTIMGYYSPNNMNVSFTLDFCPSSTTQAIVIYGNIINLGGSVDVTFITDYSPNGITNTTYGSFAFTVLVNDILNPITVFFIDCNSDTQYQTIYVVSGTTTAYYSADYCSGGSASCVTIYGSLDNAGSAGVPVWIATDSMTVTVSAAQNGYFTTCVPIIDYNNPIDISFVDCNGVVQDTQIYANANSVYFYDDFCPDTTNSNPCGAMFTATYNAGDNSFTLEMDSSMGGVFGGQYAWNFGDGDTSTAQYPTHVYAVNGIYNVCLYFATPNGMLCTYCHEIGIDSAGNVVTRMDLTGFTINVVPFGAANSIENPIDATFDIYPNPVGDNGLVSLYSDNAATYTVEIFNSIGQQLKSFNVDVEAGRNTVELPLQDLSNGMYLMTVKFGSKQVSRTFIK